MKINIFSDKGEESFNRNFLNFGYFQSAEWAQLPHVYEELSKIQAKQISISTISLIEEAKKDLPIIMHMRFGDYLLESKFGNLRIEYYEKCIDEMRIVFPDSPIWVFSDDKIIATKLIKEMIIPNFRFIDTVEMNPAEILELMRYGSAFILANSSFSWWAAFLRYDISAPVIAPTPWFKNIATAKNLIPGEWRVRSAEWI